MISDSRVHYLDEFVPHWHRVRGEALGLRFVSDPAFKTGAPEMLTTGAYSVRFGAFLGFQVIRLLGVDLTYQSLDQVSEMGGTRLVLEATPKENPNYFFSDYQQAGDQFNVANPEQHGRELHLHSFVALRDDFVLNGLPVRILNANQRSKLFSEGIFPFLPLDADKSVRREGEGCATVVLEVPACENLEEIFWLWDQPAFFPVVGKRTERAVDLQLTVPGEQIYGLQKRLRKLTRRYPKLRDCFRNIVVRKQDDLPRAQNQQSNQSTDLRRIDESLLPIHCDWLNCLTEMDLTPVQPVELSGQPDSLASLTDMRAKAPAGLFFRSPNLAEKLARFRRIGGPVDLARIVEERSASSIGTRRKIDGPALRLLSLLRFWQT